MTDDNALEGLSTPEQQAVALRSLTYQAFAQSFEYPDEEYCAAIRDGSLAQSLRHLLEAGGGSAALASVDWKALSEAGDDDDLAVEFTRLFDVGASGPPCPLYGGLYGGARMKTMEEAVRFYNYFGLTVSQTPHELPDHLTTELEFLHFLAYREAEALVAGEDAGAAQRAQRDFLVRHPANWVPKLVAKLEGQDAMAFFLELARLLDSFLKGEAARLQAELGPAPTATAGMPSAPGAGSA